MLRPLPSPRPQPLARVLLRRLLLGYALFALIITVLQLSLAAHQTRQDVRNTLQALASTFAPSIESAIWEYQSSLLDSIAQGIGIHPAVARVEIHDTEMKLSATWQAKDAQSDSSELLVTQTISRWNSSGRRDLGVLHIASSESYIQQQLIRTLIIALLTTTLQFLFLGIVLWVLVQRLLVKPLVAFSTQVDALSGEHAHRPIDLGEVQVQEIKTLQTGFNALTQQLTASLARVAEQNLDLEQRVQRRTQEVRDKEARFRSIFERANTGIAFANIQGELTEFNASFAALLDYPREALLGKTFPSFTHPDDLVLENELINDVFSGKRQDFRLEKRYLTRKGHPVWVDLSVTVLRDEHGQAHSFVGLAVDITERKATECALTEAKRLADAANQAKSDFLANMSHEIRTPMNAVMGLTQLVLSTELDPQQAEYLQQAYASSKALLGILNDILDYSKIEAGHLSIESYPLHLESLLHEIADLFSAKLHEKGLELFIDIDAATPSIVLGDRLRLSQVLNNLVGNAIKFTNQGEINIRLELLEQHADSQTLRFSVRDTGIGLSEEQISRLFQAFMQADNSITRQYGGTGLGLAICQRLVRLMGGEISVSAAPGQGAAFTFSVRVDRAEQDTQSPDTHHLEGLKVLVVGDQTTAQTILHELLSRWHMRPERASSGEEALQILRAAQTGAQAFDAVLLDWRMPDLSGIDIAREIEAAARQDGWKPPLTVIMVSAHNKHELDANAQPVHIDRVLTKPVTASLLFDALNATPKPAASLLAKPLKAGLQFQDAHVLLVEDNHINQLVARELLAQHGIHVTLANHGGEALDQLKQRSFDLIFMDLHMPVMDGLEATRQIQNLPENRRPPIVAMTAAVLQEDRDRCKAAGMVDFLAKPVDDNELIRVLAHWLHATEAPAPHSTPSSQPSHSGFELERALRRLGGNEALLHRLLQSLAQEAAGADARLDALLAAGQYMEAATHLHTLRGSASNLGATELAARADAWEKEIKQSKPGEPATEHRAAFNKALHAALAYIQQTTL